MGEETRGEGTRSTGRSCSAFFLTSNRGQPLTLDAWQVVLGGTAAAAAAVATATVATTEPQRL